MNSYLQFAKEKLFHAISENEHLLKGIFFTKHGQCVELKTVRLVTDSNPIGRLAILIKMRRDWQSYRFKEKKKNQLPSLSIIDFAIIPLKKPNLENRSEENKEERKTFNLFKKKRRKKKAQREPSSHSPFPTPLGVASPLKRLLMIEKSGEGNTPPFCAYQPRTTLCSFFAVRSERIKRGQ